MNMNKKEVTLNDLRKIARSLPKTFLSLDGRKILYQPDVLAEQLMGKERKNKDASYVPNTIKSIVDRARS